MSALSATETQNSRSRSARLDDVLTIIRGVSYKKDDASSAPASNTVPVLRATNIQDGTLVFDELVHVPRKYVSDEQLLRRGDIVVAASSGSRSVVGKAASLKIDWQGSFGAFCFGLRPKSGIDPNYLAWFLQTSEYRRQVSELAAGVNINNLRAKHIQEIPIPVPSIEQQKQIVAEIEKQFTRLDTGITALRRVQANLKRYRAAVLKAACEGRLIPGRGDWAELPLKKLIGKIGQGWSPKCDTSRDAFPGEWSVITTTAVQSMKYVDGQGKPLPNDLEPRPHLEIKPGDFLMTRKGPRKRAGVTCLVHATMPHLMVCDTVYRFRCNESLVEPRYLEVALNSPDVAKAIDRQKAGISESGVSLTHGKLGVVPMPVPSLTEQREIVAEVERRLSVIEEVEATVNVSLQRALRLRQSILQKAFLSRT